MPSDGDGRRMGHTIAHLEGPRTTCWLYDVSELYDEAAFIDAMRQLPWEGRRAQVARYRFVKDKALSLGAGLLLACMLKDAGVDDMRLDYGEHGKPRLRACPEIHFNLSHSGTMVACAVACEPVGVDVEQRIAYEQRLAEFCFGHNERAWILEQPDVDEAFTRMWVRKESYLKLSGIGLVDDLPSIDVVPKAAQKGDLWFWERELGGYALSICTHHEPRVQLVHMSSRFWAQA